MKEYRLDEFAAIPNFPFSINKGTHVDDFPVHTHNYSELVIILGGNAVHKVDAARYELAAGDVFLISGNTCHGFENVRDLKHFNVMFDLKYLTEKYDWLKKLSGFQSLFFIEPFFRREKGLESRFHLSHSQMSFAEDLLDSMLIEYENKSDVYIHIIISYFVSLASYLSRQLSAPESASARKLAGFADAVAYIEKNYTQKLSLDELSRMTHLSSRHFSRIFKMIYGQTPSEFIIKLRLEKSCGYLAKTDLPVTTIAMECGFCDSAAFSKQFKQRMGISPVKYRRQNQSYSQRIQSGPSPC